MEGLLHDLTLLRSSSWEVEPQEELIIDGENY